MPIATCSAMKVLPSFAPQLVTSTRFMFAPVKVMLEQIVLTASSPA